MNEAVIKANVRKCFSSGVSIEPERQEVCPCNTANFKLFVNNTGIVKDEFEIKYQNISSKVVLAPGESDVTEISIEIPCDKEWGEYPVSISVDSMVSGESEAVIVVTPIQECYSVSLSTDDDTRDVDVGKAVTYDIIIRNNGKFERTFDVVLEAPEWIHISDTQLDLLAGEKSDIYLYVAPSYFTYAGKYTASVKAMSDIEQDGLEINVEVISGISVPENGTGKFNYSGEGADDREGIITMNMSIPITGATIAGGDESEKPWPQILLVAFLAVGVVIILVMRFLILMK
jgi:hypothetical protein